MGIDDQPAQAGDRACIALLMVVRIEWMAGNSLPGSSEYASVLARASCAPWDAPAVAIEFYTAPTSCGEGKSARLNINLWRDLPLKEGQKFDLARGTSRGGAAHCAKESDCEAADSGTVWIDRREKGKSVSGRYEFIFKKAGRVEGKFRAAWCENRQLCR